jgi:hypothetical protein
MLHWKLNKFVKNQSGHRTGMLRNNILCMKLRTFDESLPIQHRTAIFSVTYKLLQILHYNTFTLWQVLYPIGYFTLYGLTECIINEWMNVEEVLFTIHASRNPLTAWGRLALYFRFPFHRGTSTFSKVFSCVIKRRCSQWQESLRHVSVPFHRHCRARKFDVTERVRTGLNLLDSDNVNSPTSSPPHFECLLAKSAANFCLQKWMKN